MDDFTYKDGALWCEQVPLESVAARFGTPLYVYSRRTLVDHYLRFAKTFAGVSPLVCFSVKALSNTHLLRALANEGAGLDVVSGGELHRAIAAGADPDKVVFAGVGKSAEELRLAVRHDIRCINVESEAEADLLASIAREERRQPRVAIRVNPDIAPDQRTPAKTTTGTRGGKFGVDIERAAELFERVADDDFLRAEGFHFHLGSPIFDPGAYSLALGRVMAAVKGLQAAGRVIATINVGGGFPAEYAMNTAPSWDDFAAAIGDRLQEFVAGGGQVILEPGRTIAANSGILLTTVRYLKTSGDRRVVVVDAGMTHMVRAAMYESYHLIWPVTPAGGTRPQSRGGSTEGGGLVTCDVAGPICETSDYLAKGRELPPLRVGDVLAVFTAGAYGMTMASNYNSQPRPAEALVDGAQTTLIRRRESYHDMLALELAGSSPEPGKA